MGSAGIQSMRTIKANRAMTQSLGKSFDTKRKGVLGMRGGFNNARYINKGQDELANIKKEIALVSWNDSFKGICYTAVTGLVLSIGVYTMVNLIMG